MFLLTSNPRRPAPAPTLRYRHSHSSSRFDRSPKSLKKALVEYLRWLDGDVSLTEVSGNKRIKSLRHLPTHTLINFEGPHARDDCAILVAKRHWHITSSGTKILSKERMPGWNNAWCIATWTKNVHKKTDTKVVKVAIHFAARVEGRLGYRTSSADDRQNKKAHSEAIRELAKQIRIWQRQGYEVVVSADWNLDWRLPWVREMLRREFPMLNWTWGGSRAPKSGGTHSGRLIDFTGTTLRVESARLLRDDDSSDHRPYTEILSDGKPRWKRRRGRSLRQVARKVKNFLSL